MTQMQRLIHIYIYAGRRSTVDGTGRLSPDDTSVFSIGGPKVKRTGPGRCLRYFLTLAS